MTNYGKALVDKIDYLSSQGLYIPADMQDLSGFTAYEIRQSQRRAEEEAAESIRTDGSSRETNLRQWEIDSGLGESTVDSVPINYNLNSPDGVIRLVMGALPKPELLTPLGYYSGSVYGIEGEHRRSVSGAQLSLPPQDHESVAANFLRNVVWVDLSKTAPDVSPGPYLPYVIIGNSQKSRFKPPQILAMPLNFETDVSLGSIYGLLSYEAGSKNGLHTKLAKKSGPKSRGGVDSALGMAERAMEGLLDGLDNLLSGSRSTTGTSNPQKDGSKPEIIKEKFSPLFPWLFSVSASDLVKLEQYRVAEQPAFSPRDHRTLSGGNRLIIDQKVARSISNQGIGAFGRFGAKHKGEFRAPSVKLHSPEPVYGFDDRTLEKFSIVHNLARLALSFGVADEVKKAVGRR